METAPGWQCVCHDKPRRNGRGDQIVWPKISHLDGIRKQLTGKRLGNLSAFSQSEISFHGAASWKNKLPDARMPAVRR